MSSQSNQSQLRSRKPPQQSPKNAALNPEKDEVETKPSSSSITDPNLLPREQTWLDPGTWSPSTRFLPAYLLLLLIFISLYLFRATPPTSSSSSPGGSSTPSPEFPLDLSSYPSCTASFNYSYPINSAMDAMRKHALTAGEMGFAAETALEVFDPEITVFNQEKGGKGGAFPKGKIPSVGFGSLRPGLLYVDQRVEFYQGKFWIKGEEFGMIEELGLGVPAIMLAGKRGEAGRIVRDFAEKLRTGKKFGNGAIIIDEGGEMEVRAETIGVVAPFLAYYGVWVGDVEIVREAVKQIGYYRDLLITKTGSSKGLWRHVVGPAGVADEGLWGLGNALAAWGMVRVRATIDAWDASSDALVQEKNDLDLWIGEILDAAVKTDDDDTQLLRNYLNDRASSGEPSATALLTAVAYRMANIKPEVYAKDAYMTWARRKRLSIISRIEADGIVKDAIDPKNSLSTDTSKISPQAQAFLNSMGTAWRDCVCAGPCLDLYYLEHPQPRWTKQPMPWDIAYAYYEDTMGYINAYVDGKLKYFTGPAR